MGRGVEKGSFVYSIVPPVEYGNTSFVLLAGMPADRMHASKKLKGVDHNDDGSLIIYL